MNSVADQADRNSCAYRRTDWVRASCYLRMTAVFRGPAVLRGTSAEFRHRHVTRGQKKNTAQRNFQYSNLTRKTNTQLQHASWKIKRPLC
jgi:hypothetical protein